MTLKNALGDIALDATLKDGTQKTQIVDAGGAAADVTAASALKVDGSAVTQPVSGSVSVSNFPATQPVSGTVSVSGSVPVTGPLTDAQLRAASVPVSDAGGSLTVDGSVSVSNFPATQPVSGTVSVSGTVPVSGPLTDTQLRATAVPVSGPLTDAQLRATAVPVSGTVNVGNLPATQAVSGTVAVTNLPATQPVSGSVSVSNFPAAQPVTDNGGSLTVDGTVAVSNTDFPDAAGLAKAEQVRALLAPVIDDRAGFEKLIVGTVQGRIKTNFAGGSLPQDGFDVVATGSGMTVSLGGAANGARYLNINTGVTANSETIVEQEEAISLPTRLSVQHSMSQRIANQEVYLELCGLDVNGDVEADGTGPLNWLALVWDGTNANNAKWVSRHNGGSVFTGTAASVGSSTATGTGPNFIPAVSYDLLVYAERAVASGYPVNALTAATGSIAVSINMPDPTKRYKLRWRVKNLGTAPATASDMRLHQVRVLDQARLTAELTGGVGRAADAQGAIPVTGSVSAAVSGSLTSAGTTTTTPANPTASAINSAATTNATSVKNAAGNLYSITASNTNAAVRYVKLYNKASAPTVGTDVPVLTIPVPAGGVVTIPFGSQGYRFTTGIALAITTGAGDTDTGNVAAGEIKVLTSYI